MRQFGGGTLCRAARRFGEWLNERTWIMGEYEPEDSRKVTLRKDDLPIEPDKTGPREGETRKKPAEKKHDGPVSGKPAR
jgi:hypothetical protein